MTTPTPKRRGRPPKCAPSKRLGILDAATAAFARSGFDGVNLREIAAGADVDVALIARHFGSKLGLWKAIVDAYAGYMLPLMRDLVAESDPLADAGQLPDAGRRLEAVLQGYIDATYAAPEFGMFFAREMLPGKERVEYCYDRIVQPFHALLVPLVEAAIAEGAIPPQDPDMFVTVFTTSVAMPLAFEPILPDAANFGGDRARFKAALEKSTLGNVFQSRRFARAVQG